MTEPTKLPIQSEAKSTAAPTTATMPFAMFDRLRRDIDRVFEEFRAVPMGHLSRRAGLDLGFPGLGTWAVSPPVDIAETEADYRISAELPGLDEKDIQIKIANSTLTLKGEKKEKHEEKDKDYYLSERSYGSFMRSFEIPTGVEKEKIEATFTKGILTIVLPKTAQAKNDVRKVEVKAA